MLKWQKDPLSSDSSLLYEPSKAIPDLKNRFLTGNSIAAHRYTNPHHLNKKKLLPFLLQTRNRSIEIFLRLYKDKRFSIEQIFEWWKITNSIERK